MKTKKIIIPLILAVMLLQIANVFLINTIASGSIEAATIQNQIENLEEKNVRLKTDLLKYTSLTNVSSKAAELGFQDSREFITISAPLEVASSNRIVTR